MFARGQTVIASVENIFHFGVFVRLEDGSRAYIRRRELSLSGDVNPRDIVSEGQQLEAVIIELAQSGRIMELSVRATLPDPWQEFARQYEVGDVVTATVKNLSPDRVFVQILPGVNGVIPLEELTAWEIERPEEVVWTGDRVEGVITYLDATTNRLQLSIRRRLKQLAQVEVIMGQLYQKARVTSVAESKSSDVDEPIVLEAEKPGEIELNGPILVVEDSDEVREPLVKWLSDQGCSAQGVRTAAEALDRADAVRPPGAPPHQKQKYDLVIVDLDMPGMDGLSFVRQLRKAGMAMPVAVMSGPELIADRLSEIQALDVGAVFTKPLDLDEIYRFLQQLAAGERPVLSLEDNSQAGPAEIQPFQKLAGVMRSGLPLADRFRQGLEQLVRDTRAEMGVVFHLDPVAWKVSVLAYSGDIPLDEEAVYALVDSPVKDVILEGGVVWEGHVSLERVARFRKLLELLPFESCIGVPFQAGGRTEHALFLFHREPGVFSRYRLRDALAMATLFAVALEKHAMDERGQLLGRTLLSGQLAAAFSHEVYNKLSGLDLQFLNLRSDFDRVAQDHSSLSESSGFQQVQGALDKAVETALGLRGMVEGFRRLMETKGDNVVDVNQVVRQAVGQVRALARRARVELRHDLALELPSVAGSNVGLYQVFLNLMLNAVQQMENSPGDRRVLTLSTLCQANDEELPVKIRFADTGPGIHRQLWEQIFSLGFTTRSGGSGLGLYIARSLVESMGGQISVEESLVPLGTTFLVELPVLVSGQ